MNPSWLHHPDGSQLNDREGTSKALRILRQCEEG
jgi:hypothetical protein